MTEVQLQRACQSDLMRFARELQEAFAVAIEESFGPWDGGPIPSDKDIYECFNEPGAEIWHIVADGQRIGGAVVKIDAATQNNKLELFFISPERHSRGAGLAAWRAIEQKYPDTRVWETYTPYFEQRNINFYVNKCGFRIVEFFNRHHPLDHVPRGDDGKPIPGGEEFFRFEKVMR